MSLKALAHTVLDRNPSRNQGATQPKTGRNLTRVQRSQWSPQLRSEMAWSDDIQSIIGWVQLTKPPTSSFRLRRAVTVIEPAHFWHRIRCDMAAGPNGPRARYGALQNDLRCLAALFRGPA